jgi:ribose transport system permease protein
MINRLKTHFKFQTAVPFIAFIVIFLFFVIMSEGRFLSPYSLQMLVDQSMVTIIIGCGMLFVVAHGGIDLSVGVNLAISGLIATWVAVELDQAWVMIPVSIIVGLIVGLFNGFLVAKLKVPSFMLTLAMLIGIRGLVNYIQSFLGWQYLPGGLQWMNSFAFKFPVFIVVVAIVAYVFEFTRAGRANIAIGENEVAAGFVGISVPRTKLIAFAMSGLMSGIASVFSLLSVYGTNQQMGTFLEMKVAMAVFFGGVLVTGGTSSKIYKVFLGSLSITMIVNGLAILGKSDSQISELVEGILLLIILIVTIQVNRIDNRRMRKLGIIAEQQKE